MSIHKDFYWVEGIARRQRNFKKLSEFKLNFSCPYCGDSEKDKTKARGYVYKTPKGLLKYKCHNCDVGPIHASQFIKDQSPSQYSAYLLDVFGERKNHEEENKISFDAIIPKPKKKKILSNEAKKYLSDRKLPLDRFFFHPNFSKWAKEKGYIDIKKSPKEDPRVILQCLSPKRELIGFIARSINSSTLRYMNVKVDPRFPNLVYGLNYLDFEKDVYVVEGALDSLFLDNAIAVSNANLSASEQYVDKEKLILVWDNEPRSKIIKGFIENAINDGYRVVIWPNQIKEKDINEMVLNGLDVKKIIKENTRSGIDATLWLSNWSKV